MTVRTQFRRGPEAVREAAFGERFAAVPPKDSLAAAALHYARTLGWRVFPVARDKKPLIRDWPNAASNDPERLHAWWARWPEAGIGLVTGAASGIYVVDIDDAHDAIATWQGLEQRHGDIVTAVSRTGGGGWHLLFRMPAFELRNTAGRIAPGIDTRGDGGYIVLPPSPHASGSSYEWTQWRRPQHLPAWIAEAVRGTDAAGRDSACPPEREEIKTIVEGTRDSTLASYAGALRNVGADLITLEAALAAINEVAVDPPLPHRDTARIAKSISRYTPGRVFAERRAETSASEEREWVEYNGLQLAELEDPLVEWVVPRLACRSVVTLLAGEWKAAGKTTLLISAVNAVLHGGTFLGDPVKKGGVFYLYEGPATEFRQNDFAYQLEHENFWLVPYDENAGRSWEETIQYATERCLDLDAAWLVVDTKTAWMSGDGDDENQAGFARAAMNAFATLKLENVAITVAAHPTKASTSLTKMVAGSGQWAAAAGRQVGLWAHEGVTDSRRELESVGRQGWSNNFPREVIEWDRETNTYAILGLASAIRDDQADDARREARLREMEELVTALGAGPWGKTEAYAVAKERLNCGEKKTDELLKLAVEHKRVAREVAAHGQHVYSTTT